MKIFHGCCVALCFLTSVLSLQAQYQTREEYLNTFKEGRTINTITTAVPFLSIAPDARAGGMGDCGVATEADANSMHWNLAKAAFGTRRTAISLTYSPWLRNLVPDINMAYLSFYQKLGKSDRGALVGSLRYFNLGSIQFTDYFGTPIGNYTPNEFAIDAGYSMKLIDNLSMGVAFRFIYSNLTLGVPVAGANTFPGKAGAGDIGLFYQNENWTIAKRPIIFRFGTAFTNLGSKIRYSEGSRADYIPMNFRIGPSLQMKIDDYNSLLLAVDMNKLLVPSPAVYKVDSTGNPVNNPDGSRVYVAGRDPNRGVLDGMFTSFFDAPGGFREELQEIMISTGLEYWYNDIFSARVGYFNEARQKGNRKFVTLGFGVRYSAFGLDVSYLVPIIQRHPLENTLRFSLLFAFDSLNPKNQKGQKPLPGRRRKNE
ncbi:MAG: type IX secretion system outer membrane channel protein PorV [Flavobacteriales bacterium]|nr:type IX secretion system outer membrane channel protein PorV [Flavobacteriales bacterium]MCX7649974.1 type IX secretion system outer membrane channel protein PorV [Flavobacteriales bacterium]MDW8432333.1 type IX secretion system outer membrane channel protein PorV [Flavobacteriales bacterium]